VCVVYDNATNPTAAEQFIIEKFYQSKKHPSKNYMYSALNKGQHLPAVYVRDKIDYNSITPVFPDGELAAGQEVMLLLKIYNTMLGNKGISLEAIICDEEIRYQNNASDAMASLFARGFKVMTPAAAASPPAHSYSIPA
jgi:hypothetical protein